MSSLKTIRIIAWSAVAVLAAAIIFVVVTQRRNETPTIATATMSNADTNDNTTKGTLTKNASLGNLLRGPLTSGFPTKPVDEMLKLYFVDAKAISDLWIVVTWSE